MTSLTQKLEQALAFDQTHAEDSAHRRSAAVGECCNRETIQVEAARFEHARLQPIHKALIACAKYIEDDELQCCCGADNCPNSSVDICDRCALLSALERAVESGTK